MVWYPRFDTAQEKSYCRSLSTFNVPFARIGRCKAMIFHSMWWTHWFQALCWLQKTLRFRNFTLPRSSKSRKKDSLATSISTWISCYPRNWGNRGNTEVVGFNFLFQTENTSKNIENIYMMIFMISFSNQRFCFELVSRKAIRKHLNVIQVSFREDSTDPKHPRANRKVEGSWN